MLNPSVLAVRTLREAIGSEWQHKNLPGIVQLLAVNALGLSVQITETTAFKSEWPIQEFLRTFKPAIPKDKVPTWYERLLADKLL
jgi:hypothetical protein